MRRALLVTASIALAASCKAVSQPPQIDDPNAKPPITTGGGNDSGATVDGGGTVDGGPIGACIDAPTVLSGFVPTRILYVSPTGSDSNDGKSPQNAWRSLANTGAQLEPGDRVDVAAGIYDCSAGIAVAGTPGKPVWIRSVDGPKKAVFQCGGAPYGVRIVSAQYVVIDGFDITEANLEGVHVESGPGPTFPSLSDHIVIVNNHIHGTGAAGIHVTQATNVDIFSNEIDTTEAYGPNLGGQGIDLMAVDGARVVGNSVHDIRTNTAIQVRGGSSAPLVAANLVASVLEGIHLGGSSDRPYFLPPDSSVEAKRAIAHSNVIVGATSIAFAAIGCDSCLIANNTVAITAATQPVRALAGSTGASSSSSASHTIDLRLENNIFSFSGATPSNMINMASTEEVGFTQSHNLFFIVGGSAASASSDVAIGGSGTILDKDPLFKNAAAGDYTLASSSPAAGAGVSLGEVRYTASGACRSVWNIGAY